MGNKKSCLCGYWNEAQGECLYSGHGCVRDAKKTIVDEEWIIEQAENTASDYPDVAFPNLITIFKKLLKEAGVEMKK